jgi:hypothetical protein
MHDRGVYMNDYECTCTKNTDGSIAVDPACPGHGESKNRAVIGSLGSYSYSQSVDLDSDVVYNSYVVYKIECDALDRIADTLGDILRLMERAEK